MRSVEVIKAIVLEPTVTIAKYIGFLLKIPRTFFKAWFLFQFRAISLCFVITLGVLKLILRKKSSAPPPATNDTVPKAPSETRKKSSAPLATNAVPKAPSETWKKSSSPPPATNDTVPKAPSETESNGLDASKTEEPKSEDIVNNAKKLRTYAISITTFTGKDIFWDLPLLRAKSKRLNRNLYEGDWQKIRAAGKAIEDHPIFHPIPKSKEEYDQLMKEATEDIYEYPPPVPKSTEDAVSQEVTHCGQASESDVQLQNANMNGYIPNRIPIDAKVKAKKKVKLQGNGYIPNCKPIDAKDKSPPPVPKSTEKMTSCGQVSESGDVKLQKANMNGYIPNSIPIDVKDKSKKKVDFCLDNATCSNKDSTCRHDFKQLAMENKYLKSRLNLTNCKLEDVLKSSNKVLDEVIRLNAQFSKLTTVSSKISSLQDELGEGKQLLREVEEERNEMKLKLIALEKLIKEEEEYLDEISCESGYEEVENFCDCTDEI